MKRYSLLQTGTSRRQPSQEPTASIHMLGVKHRMRTHGIGPRNTRTGCQLDHGCECGGCALAQAALPSIVARAGVCLTQPYQTLTSPASLQARHRLFVCQRVHTACLVTCAAWASAPSACRWVHRRTFAAGHAAERYALLVQGQARCCKLSAA